MDAKDFRRFGYQFIDWVADYREGLARLPVMSQVQPGEDPGGVSGASASRGRPAG